MKTGSAYTYMAKQDLGGNALQIHFQIFICPTPDMILQSSLALIAPAESVITGQEIVTVPGSGFVRL
jgi:hypothetical protein